MDYYDWTLTCELREVEDGEFEYLRDMCAGEPKYTSFTKYKLQQKEVLKQRFGNHIKDSRWVDVKRHK